MNEPWYLYWHLDIGASPLRAESHLLCDVFRFQFCWAESLSINKHSISFSISFCKIICANVFGCNCEWMRSLTSALSMCDVLVLLTPFCIFVCHKEQLCWTVKERKALEQKMENKKCRQRCKIPASGIPIIYFPSARKPYREISSPQLLLDPPCLSCRNVLLIREEIIIFNFSNYKNYRAAFFFEQSETRFWSFQQQCPIFNAEFERLIKDTLTV